MAIPNWFRLKWKEIFGSAALGITGALVVFRLFYNSKRFALDTYKGRSALYCNRKVPPGVDPWKY